MQIPVILVVVSLLLWLTLATMRWMRARPAPRSEWGVLLVLLAVGAVAGFWLAFRFEYAVSPTLRVFSFPLPLGFHHLEGGGWVDYICPAPMFIAAGNLVIDMLLFVLPLSIWSFMKRRRHYPVGHCSECGYDLTGNTSRRCSECGATTIGAAGSNNEPTK